MPAELAHFCEPRNYIAMVDPALMGREIISKVAPLLEKVVTEDADQTVETVLAEIYKGATQLWVVNDFEAILVTRIFTRGTKKILSVDLLAGDNLMSWLDDWGETEDGFARQNKCVKVEFATKRDCGRLLARHRPGFEPEFIVYRRDVEQSA